MSQFALFHDRAEDAAAAVVDACGGRKSFATELWPHKPQRDAHNLLDACLNPERREKLSPEHLVYIGKRGRDVGCHALSNYLARAMGYADPVPVEPEDELAKQQREFVAATQALMKMAERIEATQAMAAKLQRVA